MCSLIALSRLIHFGSLIHLGLHGLVGLSGRIYLLAHLLSNWKLCWDWPLGIGKRRGIDLGLRLVLCLLLINLCLFINHGLDILLNSLRGQVLLPDVLGLLLLCLGIGRLISLDSLGGISSSIGDRLSFNLHWLGDSLWLLLRKRSVVRLHCSLVGLSCLRLNSRLGSVGLCLLWLVRWLQSWLLLLYLLLSLGFLGSFVMLLKNAIEDFEISSLSLGRLIGVSRFVCVCSLVSIVLIEARVLLRLEVHL